MNENSRKILNYVLIGIVIYLFFTVVVGYGLYDHYEREKNLYLQNRLETTDVEIESIKIAYDTIATTMFDSVINTPMVTELIFSASHGTVKEQAIARQKLYNQLLGLYTSLENSDLRQLHFHLPGSISFLRFHRPGKFGDSLRGIRPAIDAVNVEYRSVNGFEEGRIFNGFRHIFPLFHKGEFVGTVELSYSFDAIKVMAQKLHPARYEMILKKSVIDAKVFKEEKYNYSPSTISKNFVSDNRLHKTYNPFISKTVVEELNALVSQEFEKIDQTGTHKILPVTYQHKGYLIWLDPLYSFDNKLVGYILAYFQDDHMMEMEHEYRLVFSVVLILIALITCAIIFFIYRLRLQHDLLVKNANTDRLTQIANRAYMIKHLDYMLKVSRRNHSPLSVIFIDIDHFKQINDTYGHRMGDRVLVELSNLVSQRIRESDIFGRWGGEEFVILLAQTELNDAIRLAEKLRIMIESHRFENGHVTCSFGVAQMIDDDTEETLIHRADAMLYVAKENGRNCVRPKAD